MACSRSPELLNRSRECGRIELQTAYMKGSWSLENSKLWSGVTQVTDWLVRIVWASLLWCGFSLLGLGILGVGPATASLSALTRKWAQGKADEVRPWAVFRDTFRYEFWRTNRLAWVMMAVMGFLAWDTHLTVAVKLVWLHLALVPLALVDVVVVAVAVYVFPLYAHRQVDSLWKYFRLAALACVLNPGRTLVMLAMLYVEWFVLGGVLPFLAVSALMYAVVRLSLAGFERVERLAGNRETGQPSSK